PGRDVPEDAPGWAAPPPPPGAAPASSPPPPDGHAPPPAPFPGSGLDGGADAATGGGRTGGRRRRGGVAGLVAGLAIVAARFLIPDADDSTSSSNRFTLPPREEGRPVAATPLTSEQVCELLSPADLAAVYDRRFRAGEPLDTGDAPTTGEPSDTLSADEFASCTWRTRPDESFLQVQLLSVPAIGGDANRTYELLRPSSPVEGFDTTSDVGDEAFVRLGPSSADGYRDSLTLRAGGVVLRLDVSAGTEPEGGLDLVVDVAQTAVANLPAAP
ncbi:MAG: hypothetical protein KDB10_10260, partial [Acidimicrobiales bacterium]|nr:hypothetical protein [Acidimicrobiales bacterium]